MGPIQQMKALDMQIQEQERVIKTLQKEHARVKVGFFFLVNLYYKGDEWQAHK